MTELELVKEQRHILSETLKKIATNRNTPAWICETCRLGIDKARTLETNCSTDSVTFSVGDIVSNIDRKDKCKYQLLSISTELDGIRLWNVRIVSGDRNNPPGLTVCNIPENKFCKN